MIVLWILVVSGAVSNPRIRNILSLINLAMDRSELAGLSAEELIAKRDTIEEEIRKQHELLDMVRTRHASCWIHGVVSLISAMGGFQHGVLCTWQLPWLAVKKPWSALAPLLSLLTQTGIDKAPLLF